MNDRKTPTVIVNTASARTPAPARSQPVTSPPPIDSAGRWPWVVVAALFLGTAIGYIGGVQAAVSSECAREP